MSDQPEPAEQTQEEWANTVLTMLSKLSDSQLDASMAEKAKALIGQPLDVLRPGIHEILDYCVCFSLASGFVVSTLDVVWKTLGGKHTDPTPWREHMLPTPKR